MAFRRCQKYLLAALVLNILVLVYLAFIQHNQTEDTAGSSRKQSSDRNYVSNNKMLGYESLQDVTVVIREFEDFEHTIAETVNNIHSIFPKIHILVIGDRYPYPPIEGLQESKHNFHYVSLKNSLWQNLSSSRPEYFLKTKYLFLIPDSSTFEGSSLFKTLINTILKFNSTVLAVPLKDVLNSCSQISFDFKKWTLEYSSLTDHVECNNFVGEHGLFMRTESLLQLSHPYLRPVPLSLYIQGTMKKWTVKLIDGVQISSLKPLYMSDPHNQWKHKHNQEIRLNNMYRQLGVKLVIQSNGRRQWYGCAKDTERCFDTVVNDMPEYLYQRKWTPPCCLQALRETSRHVFSILDSCEARYWLEGGSLLGAARHGDIIPWDYDVDIGIYLSDVGKCDYLKQCSRGSYVDESGFVWEKAREGEFYRVQYSESNRLHVDIFPFFSRNGTMTKNTWIKNHRQDTEFPERFLKPLTKIKFGGSDVNAPNNVKEFLEFKFGPGVIEHPKYPNAKEPV